MLLWIALVILRLKLLRGFGDDPADPVIGYALEAATAAGQLIRVKIKIA